MVKLEHGNIRTVEIHWYEAHGIGNRDCDELEKGKVYQILPDDTAVQEGNLRIVDESTEDCLYPELYFVLLD